MRLSLPARSISPSLSNPRALLMPLATLALALVALAPSAASQTPRGRIEATGTVGFNSLANGPFLGVPVGTAVELRVDIALPGTPLAPGQYETYAIQTATSYLKVGATTITFAAGGEPIGLTNNFPVADGVHLFATPMSSYSMEFELFDGTNGALFGSPDYESEAGYYAPALFQAIDWNVLGAGQMGITLKSLVIHPVSTWGSWFLVGGPGLAGQGGKVPFLTATGGLVAFDPVIFTMTDAKPSTLVYWVIGISALNAPFKGGVMVPHPDQLFTGLSTDTGGTAMAGLLWPPGLPHGVSLWFQMWMKDPAAVAGFSASNGLRGTTF